MIRAGHPEPTSSGAVWSAGTAVQVAQARNGFVRLPAFGGSPNAEINRPA